MEHAYTTIDALACECKMHICDEHQIHCRWAFSVPLILCWASSSSAYIQHPKAEHSAPLLLSLGTIQRLWSMAITRMSLYRSPLHLSGTDHQDWQPETMRQRKGSMGLLSAMLCCLHALALL